VAIKIKRYKNKMGLIKADYKRKIFMFRIKEPRTIGGKGASRKPVDCLAICFNFIPPALKK